jgi:flavin-binding protein dodecin
LQEAQHDYEPVGGRAAPARSSQGSGQRVEAGRLELTRENVMAIHKVIEVISQSDTSWEDAAQRAIDDAGRTVEQIKSIWIKNFEGVVSDNKIVQYRVNANITFEVK